MPSTIYKGDLAEVTFGHETGIVLTHGAWGGLTVTAVTVANTDITTLTFSATTGHPTPDTWMFDTSHRLKYPTGLLAGSKLRINGGGAYSADDTSKGSTYTILTNEGTTLTVTPSLKTAGDSTSGDEFYIESLGTPTMDVGMSYSADAASSDERVLTDQFVGLAATIALPETAVDVFRSHVVGIGRQVVVQEPQKITNEGGSLETIMHSARWLYYALGNEAIKTPSGTTAVDSGAANNIGAINMGDSYISLMNATVNGTVSGAMPAVGEFIVIEDTSATLTPYATEPATRTKWTGAQTQFHSSNKTEIRRVIAVDTTDTLKRIYVDDPFNFDHAAGCKVDKIVLAANDDDGSPNFDITPATFGNIQNRQSRALWSMWHQPSFTIETSMRTRDTGSYITDELNNAVSGSVPGSATDSKQLTRLYKGCKVKSWELTADADSEVKMKVEFDALMCYTDTGRLEDAAAATATVTITDLSNLNNGDKVNLVATGNSSHDFTVGDVAGGGTWIAETNNNTTATNLAAQIDANSLFSASAASAVVTITQAVTGTGGNTTVTLTDSFGAGMTKTNFTGGVEPGDRYTAHRMFENVGNSEINRKVAGIAPNTEKPFFFYNGTITSFGTNIAQVTNFNISGNNNVATHLVVGANPLAESRNTAGNSLEQIPFAGSRNPSLSVEGKVEYEMSMTIIPTDPLLWHEFRSTRKKGYSDPITLHLVKNGAGDNREEIRLILDDYIIQEAPLQIPEDKGVIKQELKILPRHVKAVSHDTLLHC